MECWARIAADTAMRHAMNRERKRAAGGAARCEIVAVVTEASLRGQVPLEPLAGRIRVAIALRVALHLPLRPLDGSPHAGVLEHGGIIRPQELEHLQRHLPGEALYERIIHRPKAHDPRLAWQ